MPSGIKIGQAFAPSFWRMLFDGGVEVRPDAVHLVDEGDAGHVVFGRLAPDGFRLRLHSGDAAEDGDGAVEHAKRTFHLGRKVHVPGSIDDVHPLFDAFKHLVNAFLLALHPRTGGGCGSDRDAALALLLHPVGDGGPLMNLADLVDHACVEQDAFGERGLARVDMRGNSNVARPLERECTIGRIGIGGLGFCLKRGGHGTDRLRSPQAEARQRLAETCRRACFCVPCEHD